MARNKRFVIEAVDAIVAARRTPVSNWGAAGRRLSFRCRMAWLASPQRNARRRGHRGQGLGATAAVLSRSRAAQSDRCRRPGPEQRFRRDHGVTHCGVFREDWLGIPATGRTIMLRSGEVHRLENGLDRARVRCWIDVLDLMRQAGFWPIAPSMGMELQWPSPIGPGAIVLDDGSTQPPGRPRSPKRCACMAAFTATRTTPKTRAPATSKAHSSSSGTTR